MRLSQTQLMLKWTGANSINVHLQDLFHPHPLSFAFGNTAELMQTPLDAATFFFVLVCLFSLFWGVPFSKFL